MAKWIGVCAIALLSISRDLPAQAITYTSLLGMLSGTDHDTSILAQMNEFCLAFVPTEQRINEMIKKRPAVSAPLLQRLRRPCFAGASLDSTEDVASLLQMQRDSVNALVRRLLVACPKDMTRDSLRLLRKAGLPSASFRRIADKCLIQYALPRFQMMFEPAVSPLISGGVMRADGMLFTGMFQATSAISMSYKNQFQIGLLGNMTDLKLDPPGFDTQRGGGFRIVEAGFVGRWLIYCSLGRVCGSGLTSNKGEPFAQMSVSFVQLSGAVKAKDALPTNMIWHGAVSSFRGGWMFFPEPWLTLAPFGGVGLVKFMKVYTHLPGVKFDDDIDGYSFRWMAGVQLTRGS